MPRLKVIPQVLHRSHGTIQMLRPMGRQTSPDRQRNGKRRRVAVFDFYMGTPSAVIREYNEHRKDVDSMHNDLNMVHNLMQLKAHLLSAVNTGI